MLKPQGFLNNTPKAGLAYDTPTEYKYHNEWWGENRSRADELWESLSTDQLVIAPTTEWIDQMGLQRSADYKSARLPWDQSRGLHFVKVFHQIHCLVSTCRVFAWVGLTRDAEKKNMRRTYYDLIEGRPPTMVEEHFGHCMDSLRQDIMCYADDTPMPILNDVGDLGDQQIRQCKSLDKVTAWAAEAERNACHRTLDEYRTATHQIERWQFCPEGSPFMEAKERYFRKFGHKDPFEIKADRPE